MAAPWTTYPGLAAPECVTCCTTPPPFCGGCVFDIAVLATGGLAAIADYATALEYFDGTRATADCWGWVLGATMDAVFSSDASTDDVLILSTSFTNVIGPGEFNSCIQYASIDVANTAVLTVDWVLASWSGAKSLIEIFDCTGALIDSFELDGTSGSHAFAALAGQQYVIACSAEGADEDPSFSAVFTISSSLAMVALPVIATYHDTPDVWDVEACPRLLLPDGTESSGTLYADKAAAEAVLASDQVSNCVGYAVNNADSGNYDNFVATDGGSSLELNIVVDNSATNRYMKGCVNALAGETLLFGYSSATTGGVGSQSNSALVQINDQHGNIVDTMSATFGASGSGTFTSIALPHSGKYSIGFFTSHLSGGLGPGTCTDDLVITSSGEMTANPAQALYDQSIDCAAHVECELAP